MRCLGTAAQSSSMKSPCMGQAPLQFVVEKKYLTPLSCCRSLRPHDDCPGAAWHTRTHDDPDQAARSTQILRAHTDNLWTLSGRSLCTFVFARAEATALLR